MKNIITTLLLFVATLTASAQGWPANYGGVMLQGFYWDSYTDTNWANLESQADEMSQFFDLIWVPNSAYANALTMNMGYHPVYWFDHKSAFGTETQLRSMIAAFKERGTGIIEDVVINHRASVDANWLNFPAETYKGVTYQLTAADICQDDEAKDNGYTPTGAADTGEGWGGARDLDHTGTNVQKNVNAYLDFLLNDLGYIGFRYDFVKGYAAKYVRLYNQTAKPQFSVGECWDGNKTVVTNWLNGTKVDGVIQSAAFDFPMKYHINSAFSNNGNNWADLNKAALANDAAYARYAVTFVDNHDSGRSKDEGGEPLYANVEAANAFILAMPGTPCVWLSHWKSNKVAIKKLILARKAVGLTNQSEILTHTASANGYVLSVKGTQGNVLLVLGAATASTTGYKLAVEGTNYKFYVSEGVDLSALDDVKEDSFTAPDCCVVNEGEVCAFFEAPTSYTNVNAYVWNGSVEYVGKWPGVACTKVGTNNGNNVWKWIYTGTLTTLPTYIIFNYNNGSQTTDLEFKNGGYYNSAGALQGIVTDIRETHTSGIEQSADAHWYDLRGGKLAGEPTHKGIYIHQGKKVIR